MTKSDLSVPRQRVGWRSLMVQLFSLVVLPLILLLLIFTFGSNILHENAMRDLVGERDQRAAQMAATAVTEQIAARSTLLRAFALRTAGSPPDGLAPLLADAGDLLNGFDQGVFILSADGQIIASTRGRADDPALAGVLARGVQQMGAETAMPALVVTLPPGNGRADSNEAGLLFLAPAPREGFITAGLVSLAGLGDLVLSNIFSTERDTHVVIFDQDHQVLYRGGSSQADGLGANHPGIAEALAGQTGTTYTEVQGSLHVVAYAPIGKWALLIEEPWEQVASPQLQTTHMAPLVMVPVALLALLAIFFGVRQIVQPLQTLSRQSSRLGWGDYEAIEKPVGGIDEIQKLQMELIHMAHKVRAAQRSLRSYIGAITTGQEEERQRLARELHDETIQSLIAFKQRLQLVQMDWDSHPVAKSLNELETVAEQTIENVRRMVRALRPIYLDDLGLAAALNMLAVETSQAMGVPVTFEQQGAGRRLDPPVELALYRIAQEALSNITRHSGATNAAVTICFEPEAVALSIKDNGKGFAVPASPAEFAPGGHFGLLGMFERAERLGGELQVQSTPGEGTYLVVKAPVGEAGDIQKSDSLAEQP